MVRINSVAIHGYGGYVPKYRIKDEEIGKWLRKFNRAGVPLYVFYAPGKEAVALPEIITKDMILKMLAKMD